MNFYPLPFSLCTSCTGKMLSKRKFFLIVYYTEMYKINFCLVIINHIFDYMNC